MRVSVSLRVIVAVLTVTVSAAAQEATVTLQDYDSTSGLRWLDVADQEYAATYQGGYDYDQAWVQVTYSTVGETLTGTLTATNLKPNFAYQMKLLGTPGTPTNELIGFAGRWWEQEWLGTDWSTGWNLNNKGDGSSPNPNDLTYLDRRDTVDNTSPTGYHYKYTAYRVFGYFITDENGDASVSFTVDNCYHVLWKTSQRTATVDDGPEVAHTFDPYPASEPAYDMDYAETTETIFGEWERLPRDGVGMEVGYYTCQFLLTEESFHGSGLAGWWAHAMAADMQFSILPEGTAVPALVVRGPAGTAIANNDLMPSTDDGTHLGPTLVTGAVVRQEFVIANEGVVDLSIDALTVTGADAASFTIDTPPASPVAPGGSTTFALIFDPATAGEHLAQVRLETNDTDRDPFVFAVAGSAHEQEDDDQPAVYMDDDDDAGCRMSAGARQESAAGASRLWLMLAAGALAVRGIRRRQRRRPGRTAAVRRPG